MISWLARMVKGAVIALGFILPGISGGVLAAILGIYGRLIHFLANIKENFKEDLLYFAPVGLGTILGIALFSYPVEYLLQHHKVILLWGFAGAIIGTVPSLLDQAGEKSQADKIDVIWFVATFFVSAFLLYFLNSSLGNLPVNFLTMMLAGALMALGILIPGLSPSNLLLILGLYSPMLTGFIQFDILGTFLPLGIGAGLTLIVLSKTMDYALKHYHSRVYHFIIGIVLSSTVLILIPNASNKEGISYQGATVTTFLISAFFFGLGMWIGLWMSQLEEKYK